MQHIHKFRQHEKLQQAKDQALSRIFEAAVEMSVTGRVAKDLDSIFRKGADWDLGLDHILVLQVQHMACAAFCMQQHCRGRICVAFLELHNRRVCLTLDCSAHLLKYGGCLFRLVRMHQNKRCRAS